MGCHSPVLAALADQWQEACTDNVNISGERRVCVSRPLRGVVPMATVSTVSLRIVRIRMVGPPLFFSPGRSGEHLGLLSRWLFLEGASGSAMFVE